MVRVPVEPCSAGTFHLARLRPNIGCPQPLLGYVVERLSPVPPTLVLLMGAAGTGKTTLAGLLIGRLQLVYLDNNFLADAFHPRTRRGSAYLRVRPRLYAALYRVAEENLAAGNSVLLAAPHVRQSSDPTWRADLADLLGRTLARLSVLCCRCPESVQRARLTERNEPRDHWKLANWAEYAAAEPVDFEVPYVHLSVLTAHSSPPHTGSESKLRSLRPGLDSIVEHVLAGPDGRTGQGSV